MQIPLHPSTQEQATGSSDTYVEPNFLVRSMVIQVTAISIQLLGNVVFKLQHSPNGSDWFDVPNVTTTGISATGSTTISVSPSFCCFDYMRIAWTFSNTNSVTFYGAVLGDK